MPRTLVFPFDVTIPAGTLKTAPLITPTVIGDNEVERIEWLFPDGCNGTVGIQVGARSVQVLPSNGGQFFVRSGDSHGYDLTDMHQTGDWSVIGYNTGSFPHTVHVYFYAHRIQPEPPAPMYLLWDTIDTLRGGQ